MKKWLIALLGIFMVCGSLFLSACDQEKANLSLSQESVSIEIHGDEAGSGQKVVSADVFGVGEYELSASATGYDEFITVTTEKVSATRTNIIITGVAENDSPSVVTVRVAPGNVEKYIYVDVFSQISNLSPKTDASSKRVNYLVKGQTSTLDIDALFTIEPAKANKDITWSLDGTFAGVTISGNQISVNETYAGDLVKVKATAPTGVSASVEIPVLDKIDENIGLKWSYSPNSSFEIIDELYNQFVIVPNYEYDEKYRGYVVVDYAGDLDITGYALDANGNATDDVVVNRYDEYNGMALFRISTKQGETNLNGEFTIGFKIGYADYDYAFDTMEKNPIYVTAREKVNGIILSNTEYPNLEGTLQTLYTQYVDTATATSHGKQFSVSIIPSTVIDASNQYKIILSRTMAGGAIANGCPVEIWYRDTVNANRWTQVVMVEDGGEYVVAGENFPSATTLYIKASESLTVQSAEGLRLTFQSVDNPLVSTYFDLRLVKSVSLEQFVFENGDFKIDSSANAGDIVIKKQFTLEGQTTTDGLYIINNSDAVEFGDTLQVIDSDENSVTFEITLTLKKSSYGVTTLDSYQIAHKNGLVSEKMAIDIFLPLKDVSVKHNTGENLSNSVTDESYGTKTYLMTGDEVDSTQIGLSRLMLKNDTTTPLIYSYNSINGHDADAKITAGFVDFVESDSMTLEIFKALISTTEGIAGLIGKAQESINRSNIAYFTNDFSGLITKGVGYTYAVMFFTGKGVENVDDSGNITLVKIILIESYISPNTMNVTPDKDKNVTLYSTDSLASSDSELTRKAITISFANTNVTYTDITNVEFISSNSLMGKQTITGNAVIWENGRYSLSNVVITSEGISFNIEVVGTFGELAFYDTLDVHYILRNDDYEKVYDIYTPITLTIKNAQRVESLRWKNADDEGLYFEVGEVEPQYIMVEALPSNAKNANINYVVTNSTGGLINKFVTINDEIASNVLAVNLSNMVTSGMTGYVYLMPADAVYNGEIKYYYDDNGTEKSGSISDSMLGQYRDSEKGITYFDFLTTEGYFKSNATDSESVNNISFAEILIKIEVNVADGRSFEHSYRVFDNAGFLAMNQDLYYTVMTSLDLSGEARASFASFNGGLQAKTADVTVVIDGAPFAGMIAETATIRNITFAGRVSGDGFLAMTNNGLIDNVTIDANGIYPSSLVVSSYYGGGLVGANYGTISSASVLGLSISAPTSVVGGVAGRNFGMIDGARVEFYNLAVEGFEDVYEANKFTGINVGAMVGVIEKGSTIKNSYAYSYAPADQTVLVASSYAGAFAGEFSVASSNEDTKIDYSFSVVGVTSPFSGYTQDSVYVSVTNYYIGYYISDEYYVNYVVGYESNPNFVASGDEGYFEYVNDGNPHLAGLMQDERVTSVSDFAVQTTQNSNGFYKSVAVDAGRGIMFAYAVESGANDLVTSEQNDLNELNTISLATLLGMNEYNRNIIVSSSENGTVKVVGSSLLVIRTGDITLTLSSKQDASIKKTIAVSVKYALSNMQISWTGIGGDVNTVRENSIMSLQKTRSRDFVVGYENVQVYLGTTANKYQLKQNSINLKIINDPSNATAVGYEKISENSFKLTTNDDSVLTNFTVSPTIFADTDLQEAIDKLFERKFAVQPVDGVISFGMSGETLPITPSTNTTVKVEIRSTDAGDSVVPMISYNGEKLKVEADGSGRYKYTLARDAQEGRAILDAIIEKIDTKENDGIFTFTFNVTFLVDEDYKADIAENMDFAVYFMSTSGNSSEEWNGSFTLSLTRQNFTTIDVQFKKIEYSQFKSTAGGYVEVHNTGDAIAVLAPGNSAIMQVSINPAFAYFDHVDFSYSFGGESVLDAVNVEIVKPYGTNSYTRRAVDGNIQLIGSSLRYTPTAEEKALGVIYYKLWINTTVEKDSQITLTATFCEGNGEVISYVNSYLTISYLTQPQITVDGNDTAYIAKGSTAKIQIDVLADQSVDMISLDGNNVTGVSIGALSEPVLDEVKGIKTYTATLSASVLAGSDDANMFYVQAQVSRELNGNKEYKTSVATVILVDFKLDADNVEISGTTDDALTVWQGVPKAFGVEYTILPEDYVAVDEATQTAITNLKNAREQFLQKGYYPATDKAEDTPYLVNYKYNEETKVPEVQTLKDRLFYVIGNEYRSVFDAGVDSPVLFEYDEASNKMIVTGTKSSGSVNLVLLTYISAGGYTAIYEKFFTINVDVYSHEDLPLTISSASEFNALNVDGQTNVIPRDYMLTNDIVLENYTPFDTKAIKSLDGNGYTIFIKSFNTTPNGTSTLNISLFNRVVEHTIDGEEVPTTLKNIRVNLYNGGQLTINTFKYKTINIAGLAIENEGVITNCEVVSFYANTPAVGETIAEEACTKHNNPTGFNVKYVSGTNTTEQVYNDGNMDWTSEIAGFVLTNYGSITNSRVGGDTVTIIGDDKLINEKVSGYTYASTQQLDTFNIVGQGNIAGFVLANSGGYIASSFVKNVDMENKSNSTRYYIAGFVGKNSSSILTSYVEGVESDEAVLGEEYSDFAREGSSIKSQMGYIAGFAYNNSGVMKDSYSNILIANSQEANKVYLASGFVYENEGTCENCYSASQILNSNFTQMNFSGVSAEGELLKTGTYTNCYFFNKAYESMEEVNDTTTESRYDTGALLIPEPNNSSYFYGFAIADGESDGIWRVDEEKGITLIEANNISISHRYILRVADTYEGITAEDEEGKYILPYATLIFVDKSTEINTSLGGEYNPILILSAGDWLEVTGLSESSYISEYFNGTSIWGNYRVVNNIDLSTIASSDSSVYLPSSSKSFAGSLYGNGFTISGISMAKEKTGQGQADDKAIAYGLFASIEPKGKLTPIVTNINVRIEQVIAYDTAMVGGLAGYIKEAKIINVQITFDDDAVVTGLNFAGGLAGLGFGNNVLKNIIVENPSVVADRYSIDTTGDYFTTDTIKTFRTNLKNNLNYNTTKDSYFGSSISDLSYAGGMLGFVDNYAFDLPEYDFAQKDNYSVNNVRVKGEIDIQGQVVGGVFGLIGYQTNIRDVGLLVAGDSETNNSHILSTKYFAGGIVGQSFGTISRTFASHEQDVQDDIEDNMSAFYNGNTNAERGVLDLFYVKDTNYTQEYIGGIVGFIGSGSMEISYSKLNVTSPNASFAGGIVGGMELASASTYQADSDLCLDPVFTKFFFNEVYATGDVRASEMAGGIVGVIKGSGSRVGFMAVNAFNYFTTYDYATEEYLSLNADLKNVSNNFRINALVGKFMTYNSSSWIEKVIDKGGSDYADFFIPVIAFEEQTDVAGSESGEVPSVAVYEYYDFGGIQVTMDLFPMKKDFAYENPSRQKLYNELNVVYVITSPVEYTNSSVGHSYTQEGFLNSGAWSHANWGHEMDDLFPEIKYKRSVDVLYLDCYNVESVFRQMSGSNIRVVVRGLVSAGAEEYADVDLDQYFKDYGTDSYIKGQVYPITISSYSGRLEGGVYKTSASNGKDDVKIIASQNFISSTGAGFYTDGVTVEYKSYDSEVINLNSDMTAGLFINSEVVESTIANLTIILDNQIAVSVKDNQDTNVGIVAPKLISTSVRSITIKTKTSLTVPMMAVTSTSSADDPDTATTLNIGLIAGTLSQGSTISIAQVSGISIETKANFISMSAITMGNINVGGYFGKTEKLAEAQDLRINIAQLLKTTNAINQDFGEMVFTSLKVSNMSVGGYIGKAEGLSAIATQDGKEINTPIEYLFTGENQIAEFYLGGVIGRSTIASSLSIVGQNSTIESVVLFEPLSEVKNKFAVGGFAGSMDGKVSLASFDTINLTLGSYNSTHAIEQANQEKFADDYMTNGIKVKGETYVGVVVGCAGGAFELEGNTLGSTKLNAGKQAINIEASENAKVYFGSVLGYSTCERQVREAEDTLNAGGLTNSTVKVTGKVISNAQVAVESSGNGEVVLGGIVGNVAGQSSSGTMADVQIGGETTDNLIRFDGAFYTNTKSIVVGGVLGQLSSGKKETRLTVQRTSFGGVHKIYGANNEGGSVIFGGTLGYLNLTADARVVIDDNYNYGDVFVEYGDSLKTIADDKYIFGGIIGRNTSAGNYESIVGNYSLTTSHNARQSSVANKNVNALFGSGATEAFGSGFNYYSHAVTLCTDYQGVDIGYDSPYATANLGYNGRHNSQTATPCTTEIRTALDIKEEDLTSGHKLKPQGNENTGALSKDVTTFNGLSYYKLESGVTDSSLYIADTSAIYTLKNVALIGNGNTFDYTLQQFSDVGSCYGLVKQLEGHSYISGFEMKADIVIEKGEDGKAYAPVVGTMRENSIVYAINVHGQIAVGGKTSSAMPIVSGIVGTIEGGKVFDCSTDIDITYRAGAGGSAYGIAKTSASSTQNYNNKIIERSYSAGSIKTMISANVYGVTDGWGDAIVRNCYTISKIDWNDYTASADDPTGLNIYVVKDKDNDTEVSGIYYDIDGLNFAGINSANATGKKYSEMQTNIFGEQDYSNDVWLSDINFNYGYPTLRYGYTKYSSWATRAETARGDGYDAHIMDGTYTRLENGATPSGSDNFFMIPNVGVLANMANIAGDPTNNIITGNFALLYDIDWTQRTANSEGFVPYAFIGKFDGREKTISYMQENLFTSIGNDSTSTSSTWVRNLRLTNAESTTGGILTNSIVKATVSNMTISGKVAISSGEATTIGALANSANGAIVETITNLAEISYNGGQDIKIGGIVGYTETNSTISYCSNYGIINVLINTTNKSPQAGGIVGYADTNTTIEYSFNAGSITNGYASTSGMATQEGNFYAGGIAGYANGTKILSSYNSGMVKAGNKSNTKVAYAGGIIGNGSTMTITDCYNQGSVEALGDNPTFEWKWEKNSDTGNVLALTLRQTNARNVWAYGIGHISGTITNSIVKTTTSDDANNASIYNNGTIADSGNMLKHWLWSTIEATITKFDTIEQTAKRMIHLVLSKDYRYAQFKYKATPVEPTTSTTPTVVVTSVDELEIPTAFVLKTQTKININYRRGEWEDLIIIPAGELGAVWWMSWLFNGDAGEDITIDEHYTYDYADASTDYYNKYVGNVTNKFSSITFDSSNRIGEGESGSAIMKNTRSSVDDEERSTIKIANQDYYLADKDNLTTIFNAGIYEYSGTYSSSTLPYFANTDYYSISATFAGRSVGAKIMSVEKTASGISIKYIAYDEDPLTGGNLSVTISVNYSESVTINTSSLNFIYTGNYSVGIRKINDISDFDAVKITAGYSIYSQADNSVKYTDIIKLSVASVASGSQPSDDDESLIYLAHDGEKYIYIPNAKLHETENGENYAGDLVVNNIGFTSLGSGTTFVTNVNKIKALFNGKTMYVRTATEESTYASVSYGNSGKGSYEFVGQGSQSMSKTISYGKTVSVAKSIAFGGSEGDYYYSATMSSPGEDVLALKDGSPVISYKHSTTTWGLGVSTINIAGTEMNVSVSGNKILFKSESLTGANSTIQSGINSYFNSLTWIANEEVTEVFSDNFSSMTSGTKSISLGSAGYLNIELEVNKGWTYSNPYGLTITQGNALTIKVAKNNPDLDIYSLNGVAINKGSLSFSATQSYETSITQYILMNSNSNDSYYKIELVENGVTTETIEHVGASGSHVDGYLGDAWKDFSASTIKVSAQISGTYQITKDDKDNFHIVARDDSGKLFYIEGLLSDDACAVTYISQLVKARSGDDILVAQNISGDSTIGYTISYLVNNKPILALGYSTAGISDSNLTTVYMYDNNGEGYSVALSDWREGSDYVTFKLGDESYSITKTQMETMTPFTTYQNCVTFYEQSDIKYLVLDPELTDVQSYNYVLEGETYPYKTEIERNVYAWETCTFPTSDEYVFAKFSFYSGDWSKMNIDYGSLKYIVTDQANCGVKAILADDADDRITVNVTVKTANKTGSANKAISVDSPLEPLSIILTTDISFNDIGAGFSKASSVNIIGEGYYISYFGETLYNSMSGGTTNAFIRDVSFLGETYNKSLLVGSEINKTDLYNVSLYGSVNALTNKTALIADSAPSADYTIDNFTNFASVQSVASEGTILLDVATMTASTNKGVVTALDGVHGEKGADGTNDSANISNRNGKNGTDGGKGAGIKATSVESSITFENQGILYSGNGGNGGAGGSGYKGTDKLTDNGRNNTAGSAGSAGVAGEIGDITGFSAGGTSISKKGFDGTNGARARRGFGYLSTKRTSSFAGINEDNSVSGYSYQGDSFGYEYLEHDDTAGKAQANDIYTKMFRLAGDYTTALPTPGEGAWK